MIKTLNEDPNFSIVMPGGCNAKCSFCFNNEQESLPKAPLGLFMRNLIDTLAVLDKKFYQISITGGEPLLSPYIDSVLALLPAYKEKYSNILLTTNGTNLLKKIDLIAPAIDHINVSRHHYDENLNKDIFKGTYNLMDKELLEIVDRYGARGIDVSVNCVISDETTREFIDDYIRWAKSIGVYAVRFRKENGEIAKTPVEETFSNYKVLWQGECPVCRTIEQRIQGLKVFWKSSFLEPSEIITKEIFEVVFNTDGKNYEDWEGRRPIEVLNNEPIINKPVTPKVVERIVYRKVNSCGGSSSSSHC